MENKGQIIALDIYANKLNELKRRAKRNGAFNIEHLGVNISWKKAFNQKEYDNKMQQLMKGIE